ncbi:hypothetical protein [Dactylosporangium sp. NPDC048998]|uniref:hypothetical protein n=1 Tax=Dactylosporangium sp. NPDC048998 TaxID=3363976 RepID=UPI00371011B2
MPHLDDRGDLVWTMPLTLVVSGVAVLVGVGAAVGYRITGHDGPNAVTVLAGVAVFVAVSGRMVTARNERWEGVTEPPTMPVRVRRGRVVIPRRDVTARILFGIFAGGVAVWLLPGAPAAGAWAAFGLFGSLAILFALQSFAGRVVVTPTELVVLTVFNRRAIPRHLVSGLRGTASGAVTIQIESRRAVTVPAGPIIIGGRWNYRPAELKTAGRIQAALAAVPAAPPTTRNVLERRRPVTIAAAVLATAAFLTTFVLIMSGVVGG